MKSKWTNYEAASHQDLFVCLFITATLIISLYSSTTIALSEQGVFIGTPEFDRANSIVADGSGGYYLVGASSTQNGSYGWMRYYHHDHAIDRNFEISIDRPSSFNSTLLFDVLRLPDGDLIAAGSGIPKNQAALPESQQKEDGWVIRINPDGRTIWSKRFASELHERFYFVTVRPDGTILVGGRSETRKNTGSSKGVSYIIAPDSGKLIHRNLWGAGGTHRAGFYDGVALPNGGYVLVGWATQPDSDNDDVWLLAVNSDHVEHWSRNWGGVGDDLGYQVILDDSGTISVFGWGTQEMHEYTSGLVMQFNQTGQILDSVFLNVGESGDDKFLSGIQLAHGEYIAAGEASLSSKQFRGKAWFVKLDQGLMEVEENHSQIRGSRFLGLVTNSDKVVVAAGYGIAPGEKQVDAWISEIYRTKDRGYENKMANPDSERQRNTQMAREALQEGTRLGKKGEYRKAVQLYSKAIDLNPEYTKAYGHRATTYLELKNVAQALNDLNKLIALDPSAGNYRWRADVYARNGYFDEAIMEYDKLIQLDPGDAGLYNNRANVHREKEDYEKAIRDSTKAILLDPEEPVYRFNRAIHQAKYGNYDDAMIDAKACVKLSGGDVLDLLPGEGRVVSEMNYKCQHLISDLISVGAKISE